MEAQEELKGNRVVGCLGALFIIATVTFLVQVIGLFAFAASMPTPGYEAMYSIQSTETNKQKDFSHVDAIRSLEFIEFAGERIQFSEFESVSGLTQQEIYESIRDRLEVRQDEKEPLFYYVKYEVTDEFEGEFLLPTLMSAYDDYLLSIVGSESEKMRQEILEELPELQQRLQVAQSEYESVREKVIDAGDQSGVSTELAAQLREKKNNVDQVAKTVVALQKKLVNANLERKPAFKVLPIRDPQPTGNPFTQIFFIMAGFPIGILLGLIPAWKFYAWMSRLNRS